MALFSSADEKDIEKRKQELDRTGAELERKEVDVTNREQIHREQTKELEAKRDADARWLRTARHEIEEGKKHLFEREQTLAHKEIAAKAGFVDQQREAFREAIESRLRMLDGRQEELSALEQRLAADLDALTKRDGELAGREVAVLERELKADAGFADRLTVLNREIEAREEACRQREQIILDREKAVRSENARQETEREELRKRAEELNRAEQEREAGYAEMRRKVDDELHQKRLKAAEELTHLRTERLTGLETELQDLRHKRLTEHAEIERKERERFDHELTAVRQKHNEEKRHAEEELQSERAKLKELKGQLDAHNDDLTYRESLLQAKERNLSESEQQFEERLASAVEERRRSFEAAEGVRKTEIDRLRSVLKEQTSLLGFFEELKQRLGDAEPEKVLLELDAKNTELRRLREELATRPPQEIRDRLELLQEEKTRLEARVETLARESSDQRMRLSGENEIRGKLLIAEGENKTLRGRLEIIDGHCVHLEEELRRMNAAYKREAEYEKQVSIIESPYFKSVPEFIDKSTTIDEMDWLRGIEQACIDHGLRFHPRILRAFHTALKTSEWSPLAVLAGVSGTGKSELPRLYAHFGGLPFLPLSVQPNWDSQESMLGFFNSIDNKFDPQAVLRFLAQSQKKKSDEYPGFEDAVCLILLDEMNLAHAELYFAEFLSKLELRRGMQGDVPKIDVKLGAGLAPYPLPLGRNILWAGTMNQDETTKSLSDKVLDRSIVIDFPRPVTLERRKELKSLPAASPLLPRKIWQQWWVRETGFSTEEVAPFKGFIEEMNAGLGQVGRALGHRVWQSIEYYMANYPDVQASRKSGDSISLQKAMRTAFEDQLVQKVMPKLRGIETRGRSKSECLDKIRAQIVTNDYALVDDFDLACEFGYGQFMWQSANYLRETGGGDGQPSKQEPNLANSPKDGESSNLNPDAQSDPSSPPDHVKSGEPDRQQASGDLAEKQKKTSKQRHPK